MTPWEGLHTPQTRQISTVWRDFSLGIRMVEYRMYIVGTDGHFIGYEPLVCVDDDDAVATAKQFVDGHDIEVWCGKRFVIRLKKLTPDGS
jgi:hypothetical protein